MVVVVVVIGVVVAVVVVPASEVVVPASVVIPEVVVVGAPSRKFILNLKKFYAFRVRYFFI